MIATCFGGVLTNTLVLLPFLTSLALLHLFFRYRFFILRCIVKSLLFAENVVARNIGISENDVNCGKNSTKTGNECKLSSNT